MEIKKTGKEMSEGKTEYTMKDGGFFIFRTIESDEASTLINGLLLHFLEWFGCPRFCVHIGMRHSIRVFCITRRSYM